MNDQPSLTDPDEELLPEDALGDDGVEDPVAPEVAEEVIDGEAVEEPAPDPVPQPAPDRPSEPAPGPPPSDATSGTAVLTIHRDAAITGRARGDFDPGQVELIRQTVAADCTRAELGMFLELCARYQLDPFAKQIWAAKMKDRVAIFVSRDGLLAIAHRHGDFEGMDCDVVREKDAFKSTYRAGTREIEHVADGNDVQRGRIMGAWAVVRRRALAPTYFYAPMAEYKGRNVWEKTPSPMILKVAQSVALKQAYSITGVYAPEEFGLDEAGREPQSITAVPAGPDYGEDPDLADRLRAAFDALEYTPRKRMVKLAECWNENDRRELARGLEVEAQARGHFAPAAAAG